MTQKCSISVLSPQGVTAQPLVGEEMETKLVVSEDSAESSELQIILSH